MMLLKKLEWKSVKQTNEFRFYARALFIGAVVAAVLGLFAGCGKSTTEAEDKLKGKPSPLAGQGCSGGNETVCEFVHQTGFLPLFQFSVPVSASNTYRLDYCLGQTAGATCTPMFEIVCGGSNNCTGTYTSWTGNLQVMVTVEAGQKVVSFVDEIFYWDPQDLSGGQSVRNTPNGGQPVYGTLIE